MRKIFWAVVFCVLCHMAYAQNTCSTFSNGNPLQASQLNGCVHPGIVTLTDASTIAIDASTGVSFKVTLTTGVGSNRIIGNPSNLTVGQFYRIEVVQPSSGGPLTLTYASNWDWAGGAAPTLSTAASAMDVITFYWDGSKLTATFVGGF